MLGDASRGFLLEHVLTKLLYIQHHRAGIHNNKATTTTGTGAPMDIDGNKQQLQQPQQHHGGATLPPLQIIGLSATLPNIETLCRCLNASFYRQF